MAFQNEEDYLDNLLKSFTENKNTVPVEELSDIDSELQIPEAFEPEAFESDIFESDTFDFSQDAASVVEDVEDEMNPMAALFESNMAQSWQEMTVGEVLEEQGVMEEPATSIVEEVVEEVVEEAVEEPVEPSEDELIDDYIQKLLSSDDEEATEYIDLTEKESEAENDLLNKLDDIFMDVENEMMQMAQMPQEPEVIEALQEPEIAFSDIEVDDELKELLGVDEEEPEAVLEETQGFSEEELMKLNAIQAESEMEDVTEEEATFTMEELPEELPEELDESGIEALLAQAEEVGVTTVEELPKENPVVLEDVKQPPADKKKQGIFAKILGLFQKKKTQDTSKTANENQQVLDELFDENGELLGEDKKVQKKGLFSKSKKSVPDAVETPVAGSAFVEGLEEISDLEEIPEVKKKEKKEKKKKEPKPKKVKEKKQKKPKKPKKAKPVKVKEPVNPVDLIKIKPKVVFIILLIIAGITGYTYFSVSSFSYNQALDSATFYLVNKKYTFAYEAIAGIEPKKEEDIALVEQIKTIMYVQKHYNSYERYVKMGMQFEALDSLIKGIKEYDAYYAQAVEMGISADLDNVRILIVNTLQQQYGISESMARSYGAITDYGQYVYILESYGGLVNDSNN